MTGSIASTKLPPGERAEAAGTPQLNVSPEKLDPRDFRSWTREQQISYIETRGTGEPKSVELGQFGQRATLSASRSLSLHFARRAALAEPALRRAAKPADLNTMPAALNPETFLRWKDDDRLAYVTRHGSGANPSVEIGNPPQLTASLLPDVLVEGGDNHAVSKRQVNKSLSGAWPLDLSPPPEFNIDPATLKTDQQIADFLKSFGRWFSGYWVQYIQKYGHNGILNIPTEGTPQMTAVISDTDPQQVFIVQSMDQMDFATLTYEDQVKIAKTAAFKTVKQTFGFERAAEARYDGKTFNNYIDDVMKQIGSKQSEMPLADIQPYLDQIQMLREQVNHQEIVKPSVIGKKITDIKDAFDQAYHFSVVKEQRFVPAIQGPGHYADVISLDDGATVKEGAQKLIDADRRITSAQGEIRALTQNVRTLDPSHLIMQIMRLNQDISNMKELRETEALKQRNALTETYAAMQDAVNETLRQFGEEKDDEPKKVTLFGKASYADLTDKQKKLVSMFSTLFGKDAQLHPLEQNSSLSRPLMDLVEDEPGLTLEAFTNAQWNTFSTQLSEAVTMMGQDTQIKMNEISSIRQLSTSQFEMFSRALTKSSELISIIGRNL